MGVRGLTALAAIVLAACGGPAIVDASRTVADMRSCDSAELTVAETSQGFEVIGCGEPGVYLCSGSECSEAGGEVDANWVDHAMGAMSAIEADVLECNGGQAVTIQVLVDNDGRVNGLDSHPELDDDARLCVGNAVYDNVTLEAAGSARLVAYEFGGGGGGGGSVDEAALPVDPDPVQEPVEEPVEEPGEESADPDAEAEPLDEADDEAADDATDQDATAEDAAE